MYVILPDLSTLRGVQTHRRPSGYSGIPTLWYGVVHYQGE